MNTFLLFSMIILSSLTGFAQGHDHGHGQDNGKVSKESGMTLNNGQKWFSDETLRKNMVKMHKQFDVLHKRVEGKKDGVADYKLMVEIMDKSIGDIFKNCKLEPKADATLHVILTELMSAKDKMKTAKTSMDGLQQAHKAFNLYHQYFQ